MITFILIVTQDKISHRTAQRALPLWLPSFGPLVSRSEIPLDKDSLVLGHPYLKTTEQPEGNFVSVALVTEPETQGKRLVTCDLRFEYKDRVMTPVGITAALGLKPINDFSQVHCLVKFIKENKDNSTK
jgi:hypothetical protein